MTDTTHEDNDGALRATESVWSVRRECRRGVMCVGPDRYPEAVEHRLRHNKQRTGWYYLCQSCGERNSLTLREPEREFLRTLARWRSTVEVLRESGMMVL